MIESFADEETENLWKTRRSIEFQRVERVAWRKLQMIDAASVLSDLKVPWTNHLEELDNGQWSIRISRQYRVLFNWDKDLITASNVKVSKHYA